MYNKITQFRLNFIRSTKFIDLVQELDIPKQKAKINTVEFF